MVLTMGMMVVPLVIHMDIYMVVSYDDFGRFTCLKAMESGSAMILCHDYGDDCGSQCLIKGIATNSGICQHLGFTLSRGGTSSH